MVKPCHKKRATFFMISTYQYKTGAPEAVQYCGLHVLYSNQIYFQPRCRLIATASLPKLVAINVNILCPLFISSLACIFGVGRLKNVSRGMHRAQVQEYPLPDVVTPLPHNLGKLYLLVSIKHTHIYNESSCGVSNAFHFINTDPFCGWVNSGTIPHNKQEVKVWNLEPWRISDA